MKPVEFAAGDISIVTKPGFFAWVARAWRWWIEIPQSDDDRDVQIW